MSKTHKICKTCKIDKDISEYHKAGKYYQSYCKSCMKIKVRQTSRNHYNKNKSKYKKRYAQKNGYITLKVPYDVFYNNIVDSDIYKEYIQPICMV